MFIDWLMSSSSKNTGNPFLFFEAGTNSEWLKDPPSFFLVITTEVELKFGVFLLDPLDYQSLTLPAELLLA